MGYISYLQLTVGLVAAIAAVANAATAIRFAIEVKCSAS